MLELVAGCRPLATRAALARPRAEWTNTRWECWQQSTEDASCIGAGRVLPVGERAGGPQTFAAVVATDAPLIPRQLERLAGRTALGLARTGLWNPHTREGLVLAFSTTGIIQEPDAPVKMVDEERLYSLFAAGAAAAESAVVDALLAAETVGDLKAMPQTGWSEEGDD